GAVLDIDRYADEPAGQVSLQAGPHRHEAGVRTAVEHGDAEALGRADDNVGTEFTGSLHHAQRKRIGDHDREPAALMDLLYRCPRIDDRSVGARVCDQRAGYVVVEGGHGLRGEVEDDHLDAHRGRARTYHLDGLRKTSGIDDERLVGVRAYGTP